jgi:hypothetical protein
MRVCVYHALVPALTHACMNVSHACTHTMHELLKYFVSLAYINNID